jgi:NADPH2:quinone reductase
MLAGVASPEGIRIREVARPEPGPGELLVEVRAAGLNRADLRASQGSGIATSAALGRPVGMEWSGVVAALGDGAEGFRPGDRVMCSGSGGYAQYAVCDAARALPIPDPIGFAAAAVLPMALMTMHDAIVANGCLRRGQSVLIHGASSGVGLVGLQIARHLGAALVIGSSTNGERRARLSEFGAHETVDPGRERWSETVLDATGDRGVDLVVDMVSGPAFEECMKAVRVRGRIVNVGRLGGAIAQFDFDLHALRRLDYVGVTFRTRSREEIAEIVRNMRSDLWEAVCAGEIICPIDSSFPLDQAAKAQERMRSNLHFGKIVLEI